MATYFVDLDGTMADSSHRNPYTHKGVLDDTPIWPVLTTVLLLRDAGAHIIFVTGRKDDGRKVTQEWLQNLGFNFEPLFMRKVGDNRSDEIVKAEILVEIERTYPHLMPVTAVFDDRKRVVKMWRDKGLMVFHVAEGDY